MVIAAFVFAVVLLVIFGSYWLVVARPESQAGDEVRARLKPRRAQRLAASIVKGKENLSSLDAVDAALNRWVHIAEPLGQMIARSGLKTTVGTLVLASVFFALLGIAAVASVTLSIPLMLLTGAFLGAMPFLYVRRAARIRLAKFEEQFPEAIDLIARALRAGHALPTALQMVGDEIAEPVGSEFRTLFEQQNFGMSLPDALRGFGERIPLVDARFFVTALMTSREMGGNLSDVLDKLSSVIRDRFKVKRHVRAVSAHGRITGWCLGFMPPAVAAVLLLVSPDHIRLLVDDPMGVNMVVVAIFLQVIGVLIIRRIVDVEY